MDFKINDIGIFLWDALEAPDEPGRKKIIRYNPAQDIFATISRRLV